MNNEVKAILNRSNPAWFCEHCGKESHILYMNGAERYCERCVPEDIKNVAQYYNEIFEPIAKEE